MGILMEFHHRGTEGTEKKKGDRLLTSAPTIERGMKILRGGRGIRRDASRSIF